MACSFGKDRVFWYQDYSLIYVEHTPWLGTCEKWRKQHKQGIFRRMSCLRELYTSWSSVKLIKLNLETLTSLEIWLEDFSVIDLSLHDALHDILPSILLIQQFFLVSCRQSSDTICGKNVLHNQGLGCCKIYRRCLSIYPRAPHFDFRVRAFFLWSFFSLLDKMS